MSLDPPTLQLFGEKEEWRTNSTPTRASEAACQLVTRIIAFKIK
jgi:hypothetical protein